MVCCCRDNEGKWPTVPLAARLAPRTPDPPRPEGRCVFQITNVDRQGAVVETPQGTNYFAGGNVQLSCRGAAITMQSDSVAAYGGNVVHFIGNVKYRDSTLTMDADNGTYYKNGRSGKPGVELSPITCEPAPR